MIDPSLQNLASSFFGPYELLKVNALTIGIHLVTGLLLVAAYQF